MVQITYVTVATLLLLVPVLAAPIRSDGELARHSNRPHHHKQHPRDLQEDIEAREPCPQARDLEEGADIEARAQDCRAPKPRPKPRPRPRDLEEDAFDIEARDSNRPPTPRPRPRPRDLEEEIEAREPCPQARDLEEGADIEARAHDCRAPAPKPRPKPKHRRELASDLEDFFERGVELD